MTLITLSGVGVQYAATTILRDVTFTVGAGERWGVVGRNGSGKTSLFRLITGEQAPTTGAVARAPALRFAVLDQHREFGEAVTVWAAVADAFRDLIDLEQDLARQSHELAESGEKTTEAQLARYARDLERFERDGGYQYHGRVDAVLEGLAFNAERARDQALSTLSGGERGRVALARQLAAPADVLLLDEPTNHLDLETTRWLEEFLRDSRETQLIISHDRAFLDRVVDHVLHLESETAVAYSGGYSHFVQQRVERRLAQGRAFDKQQKSLARETDYIRRNIAGQNSRQAKGRQKRLAWLPRLSPPPEESAAMSVRFAAGERGGDQVVVFERVGLTVGERVLVRDFSGWIRRGEVIGLVGPNGAGKSTLLKTIVGARTPDTGEARVGGTVEAVMYTQDFANVPRDKSIYDVIADLRPMWERGQVMAHLGRVQFSGDEVRRSTSSLSGGELARVALALMMLSSANFLIFDEPTNHLDVESIEALEDAIDGFEGTVLLVSHDRELLRKLATVVWELRDGHIDTFDGGFAEWEERWERRITASAQQAAAIADAARERERAVARDRHRDETKDRRALRESQRAADEAERRVSDLEGVVRELSARLEDQQLYEDPARHKEAIELAQRLDETKRALTQAVDAWEAAMAALEQSTSTQ